MVVAENALELASLPAAGSVSLVNTVPSAIAELVRSGGLPASVRTVNLAGEPLQRSVVESLYALGTVERVYNLYGPSEDTTYSTGGLVERGAGEAVTIGLPLAGKRSWVLDGNLRPVPVGVAGELYLSGEGLARGYLNRPGLTAERWVPDPLSSAPGGRLYRTGDLARRLADGRLVFLGRIDHQVKVRGFRIELGEVEAALLSHAGVREAVAVARADAAGMARLVAYVVPEEGEAPSASELREHLRRRLPEPMVPSALVSLASLPLTPNGKVDRKALPEPEGLGAADAGFVAPRTPAEELLAGIWSELLGRERIGIHDNFFELGGHSLLATRVLSRLRGIFGVELPVRALFESPTVAALASQVERRREETAAPPLAAQSSREGDLPLSFSQERLWFLDQLEPGSAAYNIPAAFTLSGTLDVAALRSAFVEIVRRHEALRTSFVEVEGRPAQRIAPASGLDSGLEILLAVPMVDLSGLGAEERERELSRLAAEEAGRPFDLSAGPLVRLTLLRLDEGEHAGLLNMHHIVSDGWSIGVLVSELTALYPVFAGGAADSPSPLPELPVQYADYALWQRQWLQGEVLEGQLAWWRERLAGAQGALELPTDRPRPAVPGHRGGRVALDLSPELTAALLALGRRGDATLFMTLLAGWSALLSRCAGQPDVLVGSPIANRNRLETEGLIGFFVNTLVLRADLAGDPGFAELLSRVRHETLGAYAHQDLPFERLVQELQPDRHLSRSPLFQMMFALQNAPRPEIDLPGLALRLLPSQAVSAKFDLTLVVERRGERLSAVLEYSRDLFDAATALRLLERWRTLLAAAAAAPESRTGDLPLLTEAERRQVVEAWNDARTSYPSETPIHRLFEAQVEADPEAVAVVSDGESWTYAELNRRANRLAHHLRSLGVRPETPVALCLEASPELVAGLLAVLKAGGLYVPLDPSYPEERLAYMLEDSGAAVLVTRSAPPARLAEAGAALVRLDADGARIARRSARNPRSLADLGGAQLAYVMYTSGSTGRPKGIGIPHRAIARLVCDTAYIDLGPADRVAQISNVSFDAATFEIWGALLLGGSLICLRKDVALSPRDLAGEIGRREITTLFVTTALFNQLVDEEPGVFRGVRHVLFGGEAVDPRRVREALRHGPPERLLHVYGPTENTTFSTWHRVQEVAADAVTVPIGATLSNSRLYVLDARLQPVPVGVAGELYLGGDGLARGYHRRPELTAERFVPCPPWAALEEPGARLYRTGDRVRLLPDGAVEFLGRIDGQVKLRGFRIEPGEIEALLARHPAVAEAVVLVREDAPGDRRLVAYVVPRGERPAAGELRQFLKQSLPDYMVPSAFVPMAALPLTPNGKVDRRALPAPDADRAPEEGFVAPRTPVEEVLAGLWAEVLGVERIGVHDSFFELGGHSLLATRLASRLRGVFGVELPLRTLFDRPTLAELAAAVGEARGGGATAAPPIVPVPRHAELPLSFSQERLWFLDQLEPGGAAYNVPAALALSGALDVAALARALGEIARRHEALRTTFAAVAGRPVQRIAPAAAVAVPVVDLTALATLSMDVREAEVARRIAEEIRRPFDLERGPLLRLTLLRLAAGEGSTEHLALLGMHHIVSDGWSMEVLVRELTALYTAFAAGGPSPLAELPVQYADYAVWQREWLRGETLAAQLSWWRSELADAPAVLELPFDRPRPAVPAHRGGQAALALDNGLARALEGASRRGGATLFMGLLAGWSALLSRCTAQEDLAVGSPIANRNRLETEGLIGFFVNTLVLRTDLSGDPGFGELVARVRRATLGAYDHQDLPFERLVEELQPERHLAHSPLFQVSFALQNVPRARFELPGLVLEPLPLPAGGAKFDLSLLLDEREEGIAGVLRYDAGLFDAATAQRMAGHLANLLAGAAADPALPLSRLPLLSEPELAQLRVEWNDTRRPAAALALRERFEAWVRRSPGAPAVAFEGEVLTYAELDERANRLAARLLRLGVGPETRVGLLLERSAEVIVALLAVWKAGGAYVPLDPAAPAERLAFLAEQSGMAAVLTRDRDGLAAPLAGRVAVLSLDAADAAEDTAAAPPRPTAPESLAYVIYTSGSTGYPKGVAIEHRQVASYLDGVLERLALPEGASFATVSTFAADLGNTMIFAALATGGCLHVIAQDRIADAEGLGDYFERHPVDCLKIVPSHLAALLASARPERILPRRLLVLGGEASHWRDLDLLRRLAESCRVLNHYGPTETTVGVATFEPARSAAPRRSPTLPLGRPLPDSRAWLLGPRMAPVPMSVPGELFLGGANVARGYLDAPALTAERFLPDPFSPEPGARMYRTGDLVRLLPDGSLDFLGRIDHQVKIRGFRVELREIEAVLGEHPGVRSCAVVAREDRPGDRRLVAYVVSAPEEAPEEASASGLRASLARRLPEYMVPSAFVHLPALPVTANGKVDLRRLPAPLEREAGTEEGFQAPRTPAEELLAGICAGVLGLERIGVHDNFFERGGHSLLATQVMSRIRQAFQVEMPLRALFESPTVAGLAEKLAAARQPVTLPPLRPAPRVVDLPLGFAQERLWFLDQLQPGQPTYNLPYFVRLEGRLDRAVLERVLNEVVRRHEALRSSFPARGGRPVTVVAPTLALALPHVDLRGLPAEIRQAEAERLARAEARRPFDLERGPLVRAQLVRTAEDEHLLLLGLHHIVSDAWSRGVLLRETAALYQAFGRGLPSPLPELAVQYPDFAVWQREWLRGEVLEQHLGPWRRRLAGAPAQIELPTDRPRPAVATFRGAVASRRLAAGLGNTVRSLGARESATPFMVLLSGFLALLHRYTGQETIPVGSPIANRNRAETEGLIGLFVNTLVLVGGLAGDPGGAGLLARVREAALDAYAHQDLPFEKLVAELAPERNLGHTPLFQVVFVLQNAPLGDSELPDLRLGPLDVHSGVAKFDLTLTLEEKDGELRAYLEHNADLFEMATAWRILGHFERLVEGIAADPSRRLSELPLLTEPELRQLLAWNGAPPAQGGEACLHRLFAARAAAAAEAVAVVCEDRALTYRELEERAARVAAVLRDRGVGPEVRVGLCVERSLELVVGILGILKAGGAYVPLDPAYPADRLAFILGDAGIAVLLTQEHSGGPACGRSPRSLLLDAPLPEASPPDAGRG